MRDFYRPILFAVLAFALPAVAQTSQPGPESAGQNRNEPSIKIQENQKPSQPSSASGNTGASTQSPSNAAGDVSSDPSGQPQTQILPGGDSPGSSDPLLQPAPLPEGSATLVGGTAEKVDQIRNRIRLQPFGGGKRMDIRFDDRSHFYRDGREVTILGIKNGDRVYADTMLVDGKIFARNLRVQTQSGPAEAHGQITSYDAASGRVTMQDQLTSQPVRFTVSAKTAISRQSGPANASELRSGAMIDVLFAPGGGGGEARQINVLALPGANYMFAGRVTHLDMRTGTLAIENETDLKTYDLLFDPSKIDAGTLAVGSEITANTVFDGHGYTAQTLTVEAPADAKQ